MRGVKSALDQTLQKKHKTGSVDRVTYPEVAKLMSELKKLSDQDVAEWVRPSGKSSADTANSRKNKIKNFIKKLKIKNTDCGGTARGT